MCPIEAICEIGSENENSYLINDLEEAKREIKEKEQIRSHCKRLNSDVKMRDRSKSAHSHHSNS
jgi:hypothetical protein